MVGGLISSWQQALTKMVEGDEWEVIAPGAFNFGQRLDWTCHAGANCRSCTLEQTLAAWCADLHCSIPALPPLPPLSLRAAQFGSPSDSIGPFETLQWKLRLVSISSPNPAANALPKSWTRPAWRDTALDDPKAKKEEQTKREEAVEDLQRVKTDL